MDIKKLQDYLNECESTISEYKDRQRDIERQLMTTKDHGKQMEQCLDKSRQETADYKR